MILFEIVTYFYQKAEKWDNYALFLDKKSAKCEDWPPQSVSVVLLEKCDRKVRKRKSARYECSYILWKFALSSDTIAWKKSKKGVSVDKD